jgi:hypothetical protein
MRNLILILASCILAESVFASTNAVPWSDDFEGYTNNTPLINGTNGWFGSSADIIAQNAIFFKGAQAVKIPVDCTLSNRFSGLNDSVWLRMDVKVARYNGNTAPSFNTNSAAMFYVSSNGYFTVANSTNWAELGSASSLAEGQWVKFHAHLDYVSKKWELFADWLRLTNNIGFLNQGLTNFTGFDIYSGNSTSYLDNAIAKTSWMNFKIAGIPDGSAKNINGHVPCKTMGVTE